MYFCVFFCDCSSKGRVRSRERLSMIMPRRRDSVVPVKAQTVSSSIGYLRRKSNGAGVRREPIISFNCKELTKLFPAASLLNTNKRLFCEAAHTIDAVHPIGEFSLRVEIVMLLRTRGAGHIRTEGIFGIPSMQTEHSPRSKSAAP